MEYFQSNKIIKLIFLLIWPFFILRVPTYFNRDNHLSQFDITNIKNLTSLSMDVALLFIFCFLILIQIIYFFKHRIISKSIILIIYPIIGVIGYYANGYKNLYQEGILLHHFITLSATFLFFSFIQSNKLFDYKFKELCLKIILSIIFIYFLSIILPSLVLKLYLGDDIRFSSVNSVFIFSKEINLKQNINGQTKFIFILLIFTMVLFRKCYSNKKKSYLFFLIGLILISLVYLTQSRLNILASFIFSFFIIISFQDLTLKNKISFLILIFTIPFLVFNLINTMPNRFVDQYRVVSPVELSKSDTLILELNKHKELILLNAKNELADIIVNSQNELESNSKFKMIFEDQNDDGLSDLIIKDKNFDGKPDTWFLDENLDGVYDMKGIDTDNDNIPDIFSPINKLDTRSAEFNLEIFNLELLNKNNKINYDVYLDQSRYLNEIWRIKRSQRPFYNFSKIYPATLKNFVSYNKNIVLGKCLNTLVILDSILSGRLCGWQILFDIIKVPELIFGKGFFADQVYLQPIEKVASNSFVNILFNTGFISLLIYMAVILIFFIRYFKFKNLNHANIYISISHYYFIYFIFRSFFEDTLAFVSIDLLLLGSASVLIKHYSQRANN